MDIYHAVVYLLCYIVVTLDSYGDCMYYTTRIYWFAPGVDLRFKTELPVTSNTCNCVCFAFANHGIQVAPGQPHDGFTVWQSKCKILTAAALAGLPLDLPCLFENAH